MDRLKERKMMKGCRVESSGNSFRSVPFVDITIPYSSIEYYIIAALIIQLDFISVSYFLIVLCLRVSVLLIWPVYLALSLAIMCIAPLVE